MDEDYEESGLSALTSNTDSISKGVFAFKNGRKRKPQEKSPKKKRSKKKRSKVDENQGEDELALCFGDSPSAKFRYELYEETWNAMWQKMKGLQKNIFDKVLHDVVDFCTNQKSQNDLLPTCALVTGVNLPDHKDLFKLLCKSLKKNITDHIASIRSQDSSTLKSVVKRVLLQLHRMKVSEENESSDEESEEEDDEIVIKSQKGKFVPTLSNFATWHENQYNDSSSKPPLILIFEDFEGFPSAILQDLIANLQIYSDRLPFMLIFGVATTVDAIHRTLTHASTSRLAIHSFASAPSIHLLANFVESLVMDTDIPFKLGGKVLKQLLEMFSFHDLSVRHFLMGLKCCLLEHFSSNEASILCSNKQQRKQAISLLNKKKLSSSQIEQLKKEDLETELNQMDDKMALFSIYVTALHSIVGNLPKTPLGKNFHHVYNLAMSEPVIESHEYREAFQFLKLSERSGLIDILKTFLQTLTKFKSFAKLQEISKVLKESETLIENLENIETSVKVNDASSVSTVRSIDDAKNDSPNKKLDRFKLAEVLLAQAKEKKLKSMNPYEVLREKIMTFFHETFKNNLGELPSKWLWYDVFYYNDLSTLRSMLIGAPRNSIQIALKSPYQYLKSSELKNLGTDEISPVLPDISVAFKLHLECGKLINLYDWLQCWVSIVGDDKKELDDGSSDNKVVNQRMHARFSRAVSELQFLGFIKPSKRKTDHVERLTF